MRTYLRRDVNTMNMKQDKTPNIEEGIMDILKGIHKILGIDGMIKSIGELNDAVRSLTTELSKKVSSSELEGLKQVVEQIEDRIDSTQGELQSLHIREEKDYSTAVEHFMKINESIGSIFKKDDTLRYFLFDLLVYNKQETCEDIDRIKDSSDYTKDKLNIIYNLKKEIIDFHKKQVDIINKKINISQTDSNKKRGYQDAIIYPHEDEIFDKMIHENLFFDEGNRILKTLKLGYSFPNYEKKASVTLK